MNNPHRQIDSLLRQQPFSQTTNPTDMVYRYAESLAMIEKSVVVVSDLKHATSTIFHGTFSEVLGLTGITTEHSIWEKEVLCRMSSEELEEKYLTELRFFNFIRNIPPGKRDNHYLVSHLKMTDRDGNLVDVLHRMHYWHERATEAVRFGICIYGPLAFELPSKNMVINSVTGKWSPLSSNNDNKILSAREKQVLSLIEQGLTSQDIADALSISKHTVSRHRQEILSKLQVKNSTEACRRAKLLNIITDH